jgi:hypothetical protein
MRTIKLLGGLAAMVMMLAAASQTVAAFGQSNTGATGAFAASSSRPFCLKGQRLKGSKKRGYECWFRKHRKWWAEGVECRSGYQRKNIYRHRHYTGEICVPTLHTSVSTPLSLSGSITNVRFLHGYVMEATYSVSGSGCTETDCHWYPHAFQLPAAQRCEFGDGQHRWIFKGYSYRDNGTELKTAEFNKNFPAPIRLCLFVEHASRQYLVAEAVFDLVHPTRSLTPLTVNNVCTFNPGLGVHHAFRRPAGPGVYWDNNNDGVIDFAAFSYEGDNVVDAVFVNDSRGVLTWIAHCNPHETPWISYAQVAKALSQPQPQPQQPQSQQQLQQAPPPFTGNASTQLLDILTSNASASNLYSPLPSYQPVGTIEPCGASFCITEPPPDPTVL